MSQGMFHTGEVKAGGKLGLVVIKKDSWIPEALKKYNPRSELGKYIRTIIHLLPQEAALELIDRASSCLVSESKLFGKVFRADGRIEDHGLLGTKLVTTAGVNFIVDAFQNLQELENFKFHGLGTGATAATTADSALQTELTTQYGPSDSTRATGNLTEGASSNIFRSVGTNTVDASAAVTEFGIFTQAAVPGGVLLDRFVFSVVNLTNGDGLQTTFDLTFTAGG